MKKICLLMTLAVAYFSNNFLFCQNLVLNEISQGPSGNKEYIEMVVTWNPSCVATVPCIDLRGYYLDDNNGTFAAGAGVGIATGCIRLTNDPLWSCVPAGTLIVIHNDLDPNGSVPANDLSLSDGNCRLIIPISNCTLIEKNTSTPSTTISTFPTSGFSNCGAWAGISMANGGDSFQIANPTGTVVHAVSWGNNTLNNIVYLGNINVGTQVASFTNNNNNNPSLSTNWTVAPIAGNETPGLPNNTANAIWLSALSFNCTTPAPLTVTSSTNLAACNCNGSATINANGSIGPYTYSWMPSGGNSSTATNLCPGQYTVNITSSIGCSETHTLNIGTVPTMTVNSFSQDVSCNGGANGNASISITGGTSPYSVVWSPAGGTNTTASGLSAGNYTASVSDAGGCTENISVSISEPSAITAIANSTQSTCGQNNGSVSVLVSGGTPPYTVLWSPGNLSGTTITNLPAGAYIANITDNLGCTFSVSTTVGQPSTLSANISVSDVSCFNGTDGTASINISGGNSPYSITWSQGSINTNTISGLSSGSVSVTVLDNLGCSFTTSATINQPQEIQNTFSVTNISCNGLSDGSIQSSPTGGTAPYNFSWSTGISSSTAISGLSPGTYTLVITDAESCVKTDSVIVSEPSSISIVPSFTNPDCSGNGGSASVLISGGIQPYAINWLPTGGSGISQSGLTAGNYTVLVVDSNNCADSVQFTLVQNATVNANLSSTNVSCFGGNDGSASATITSGNPPYTITWSPTGGNNQTATNLSAGNYTISIIDNQGCQFSSTVSVSEPDSLSVTASVTNASCFGSANGSVSLTISGGTNPYSTSWQPGNITGSSINNLSQGTYSALITDNNGCTKTVSAIISEPNQILSQYISSNISCNGGSNGAISLLTSGGTAPYLANWSPNVSSGLSASSLAAGTYNINITDANGCSIVQTVVLTEPSPLAIDTAVQFVICRGDSNGSITSTVTGGTSPYTFLWNNNGTPTIGTGNTLSSIPEGNYNLIVSDAQGCMDSIPSITVGFSSEINIQLIANPSQGNEPLDVNIIADALIGNVSAYSWTINSQVINGNIDSLLSLTALSQGTYTVQAIGINSLGCLDSTSVQIVVDGNILLVIPNIFTPNNDQSNDVFEIQTEGFKMVKCFIYNRWGILMWESQGQSIRWDGRTTSGNEAVDGTYYFIFTGEDIKGKSYSEKGHLLLVH